jgi:hypothetical protein
MKDREKKRNIRKPHYYYSNVNLICIFFGKHCSKTTDFFLITWVWNSRTAIIFKQLKACYNEAYSIVVYINTCPIQFTFISLNQEMRCHIVFTLTLRKFKESKVNGMYQLPVFADHNNLRDKQNTKKKRESLWKQDPNVLKFYACSFVVSSPVRFMTLGAYANIACVETNNLYSEQAISPSPHPASNCQKV